MGEVENAGRQLVGQGDGKGLERSIELDSIGLGDPGR